MEAVHVTMSRSALAKLVARKPPKPWSWIYPFLKRLLEKVEQEEGGEVELIGLVDPPDGIEITDVHLDDDEDDGD